MRRAATILTTGLAILSPALAATPSSASPAGRVVVQTVTAKRVGGGVGVGVLVRNRGGAGARASTVRVEALRGGEVVAHRRAPLAAVRPGRTLRVLVVLATPANVPAVRLRACVATRCRQGPVVRLAQDAHGAAPAPAPAQETNAPPAPAAHPAAPDPVAGPQPPGPQVAPDPQPQPDPAPAPALAIDPARQTIDRGDTVHFTAGASDVAWDLDGDGEFDDAEGAQADERFVRSGDVEVRARTTDGVRIGSSAITIRYPGGPLPWRDEATNIQQDASHTGYQPSGDPAPPLARRWSVDFGGAALGAPLIAGGRIFVLVRNNAPVLVALDPATGGRLWERPLGAAGNDAVLSYDGGRVLLETDDELLQVFDAVSGDTVGVRPGIGQNPGPTVAYGGRVVVGGSGPVRAFGLPGLATAWTGDRSAGVAILPAFDRADVFTPGLRCGSEIASFDLALGEHQWSRGTSAGGCSGGPWAAAVYDGLVFSTGGREVRSARDGAFVRALDSTLLLPAFAGDRVLLTDADGHLRAEGLRDGRPLWHDSAPAARPPLVVGDRVYVVRAGGLLVALDLASGAVLWSEQLSGSPGGWADQDIWTGSAAAEGVLLVPWQGTLTAFEHAGAARPPAQQPVPPAALDLPRAPLLPADAPAPRGGFDRSAGSATGLGSGAPALRWQTPPLGQVGDAIVVAGRVYAVTNVGFEMVRTLRAFDALTGLQLWSRTGPGVGREVVYGGGAVYVRAAGRLTYDGVSPSTVTAYDALTGLERWSTTLLERDPSGDGLVYDAGTVYIAGDRHVMALGADDGDVVWDVPSQGDGDYPVALRDGLIVRPLACGVEALRVSDGQLAWDDKTCTGGGGGDVAIAGGRVFGRTRAGFSGLFYDLAGGHAAGSVRSTAQQAFFGGVGVQVLDSGLQAIDLPSGRRRWRVAHMGSDPQAFDNYRGILAPVVTRDQVVAGIGHELHGYDLGSGAERWSLTLPHDITPRDPFGLAPSLNAGDGLLLVPLGDGLAVYGPALDLPGLGLPLPGA